MIIETNPCDKCECIPELCGVDIEICQMTCGESRIISSEEYENQKEIRHKKEYMGKWHNIEHNSLAAFQYIKLMDIIDKAFTGNRK